MICRRVRDQNTQQSLETDGDWETACCQWPNSCLRGKGRQRPAHPFEKVCCVGAAGDNKCVQFFGGFFQPAASKHKKKSRSNSKSHPWNRACGLWMGPHFNLAHRNLRAETVGAQPWPPAASVSTEWLSCDNSLQLTSACGGWVAYTNTRADSDIPIQRQLLSEVFVDRGVLGDPSQAAQSSVGVLF